MNPQDLAKGLVVAVQQHHWQAVLALSLIAVVAMARAVLPRLHAKAFAFLNTDRGAAGFTLVTSMVGAVGTALLAGTAVNGTLLWAGATTGFMAAGGWATMRRLLPSAWWDIFDAFMQQPVASAKLAALKALPFFLMFAASCACFKAGGSANPSCRTLDIVLSCAEQEALPGFMDLISAVLPLVDGKTVDWVALEVLERNHGTSAVSCALQKLLSTVTDSKFNAYAATQGVSPEQAQELVNNVKQNIESYFKKRHIKLISNDVKFGPATRSVELNFTEVSL